MLYIILYVPFPLYSPFFFLNNPPPPDFSPLPLPAPFPFPRPLRGPCPRPGASPVASPLACARIPSSHANPARPSGQVGTAPGRDAAARPRPTDPTWAPATARP